MALCGVGLGTTYFLLDLETIYNGCKLAKDLIGLLVELELGGDQVGKVSQGFRGIKDLLVLV